MKSARATLTIGDGASRRVDALGILIGRAADCDIVVPDPHVSRRHALVHVDSEGCELVSLGRTPLVCNDKPCVARQRLRDGDRLRIASLVLSVAIDLDPDATYAPLFQVLVHGTSYGVTHNRFAIGGGSIDSLVLDGWPPGALILHRAQDELFVEAVAPTIRCNGRPLELGELVAVAIGDTLEGFDTAIAIGRGGVTAATTTLTSSGPALPAKVVVEMLPRGGRVVFSMPSGDHCVYLADRRLDLIAALLRPPRAYLPGDYIPDDVLRPLIWPRNPNVIRSEINVHITRCRRDLVSAGLAGPRLIERSPGGGATRLALAPNCEVVFL